MTTSAAHPRPRGVPERLAALRVDAVVALAVGGAWWAAVSLARRWDYWHPQSIESFWWAGLWLVVPLALRRSWPGVAFWLTVVVYPWGYTSPWLSAWSLQSAFHLIPVLLAVFIGARARSAPAWVSAPVGVLAALWLEWGTLDPLVFWVRGDVPAPSSNVTELLLLLSLVAAAAALGAVFARLDDTLASLAERNRELEALQEVRTREAVQSERVRIARDLHDVVAHHVSAIVVRAQAVDRVGGDDVEVYRDAVRWIAPEGRNALDAMRSLVRVLREDSAPLAPTSTLADLGAVVERMRGAGLELDARLPRAWPACPAAVGLAVVRVAQEALTNVVSHSAAGRAAVSLDHSGGRLVLEVTDPGPPRPAATPGRQGNGLMHMRERAVACGGTLAAGPLAGGHGWQVRMEVALDGQHVE
ncbi:sensor histidine kinase [Actinotalea fermentans]|uniref:histidine kinase n=1 Tax=Actinotalea fermentans TaxID=43671 RepID=A0A511YX45_9CELL|nr:histidine kinase [Actinotalea fermentans]GEN79771.1 hypothetical protein AFE02nite_15050 [Actinotalea fermentans]